MLRFCRHFVIIFCVIVFQWACNFVSTKEPESVIVNLLKENKIVMLADFGHHTYESYVSLLRVIDTWIKENEYINDRKKLNIILEYDSVFVNSISYCLETNDNDSLYKLFYSFGTLEDLEFYQNIKRRVDELKAKNKFLTINFNGCEKILDTTFLKLTNREGDLWFVKERDSITAYRFVNLYEKSNRNDNYLIFYGGVHLKNGLQNKSMQTLNSDENRGYFLAYYLKKYLGDDRIVTVNQVTIDSIKFRTINVANGGENNVIIKNENIRDEEYGNESEYANNGFDYTVFWNFSGYSKIHRLDFSFSKKNIEQALIKLEYLEKFHNDTNKKFEYEDILEKIFIITGLRFKNAEELMIWYKKDSFKGLSRIFTQDFKDQLFTYFYEDIKDKKRKKILNQLGFGDGVLGPPISRELWRKEETEGIKFIAFHNALTVYWIGFEDEKEFAKDVLNNYSKQDYQVPIEYLKWFRKTYYERNF